MNKLIKLDYRLISSQIIIILCAILFSVYLGVFKAMPTFSIGILFMMTFIFSTVPFNVSSYYKSCFYNMLPVSTKKKVLARYWYLFINIFLSTLLSFIIFYYAGRKYSIDDSMGYYKIIFIIAITCLSLCSVQYVIYYKIENIRNQQFAVWFRLIPAFALMFFVNIFSERASHFLYFNYFHLLILTGISIFILSICIALSFYINAHKKN